MQVPQQMVALVCELVDAVLDHVANGNQAVQFGVNHDRDVSHSPGGHDVSGLFDAIGRLADHHSGCHQSGYLKVDGLLASERQPADDVALADDAVDVLAVAGDDHGADVVLGQQRDQFAHGGAGGDGNHSVALAPDDILKLHNVTVPGRCGSAPGVRTYDSSRKPRKGIGMVRARQTAVVRSGIETDGGHGAVVPPVYLSTNYSFEGLRRPGEYEYSRAGNPTRATLAAALAELDGAAGAVVTASGMGAISATVAALTKPGDLILAPHDAYGGTWRLLDALARKGAAQVEFTDLTSPDAAAHVAARAPALVWVETPSNPLLRISDLAALAAATHAGGGVLVADNTFCSPLVQRPLELGADVVVQSTTKYLNGHSDVVGGVITAAEAEMVEQLGWWANCIGVTGGAFDSYLTLRGLRTLPLRMRQHLANAAAVVEALDGHPAVERLYYPGLPSHPGHDLAARQMDAFGAIVSFEVAGGESCVASFLDGLENFSLAESLGGVESLVCHPASMTHAAMPAHVQDAAGLSLGLVRLSVGIEDAGDLVEDLMAGLDRIS